MGSGTSRTSRVGPTGQRLTKQEKTTPVDNLTLAQLEEFQEAFDMFDKDGGGSIDAGELKELMKSIGQYPTDEELHSMVSAVDADGTGDIDFCEFAALMAHKMHEESKEDAIIAAFKVFDQSGDGRIDPKEMRKILVNLGEDVTIEDVETVLKAADQDGDGFIDYKEFTDVILGVRREQFGKGNKEREASAKSLGLSGSGSADSDLGNHYSNMQLSPHSAERAGTIPLTSVGVA